MSTCLIRDFLSRWPTLVAKGKRISVPLMEEGKGLVGVRRLAKMSELKENIEPKTLARAVHLHFS